MFTGLIQDIGEVVSIEHRGDMRAVLKCNLDQRDLALGASVACDGCCLTVVDYSGGCFGVDISAESLSKTMLGSWEVGSRVNLEPSLRAGDALGGHIVSGHVDGRLRVQNIVPDGDSYRISFMVPEGFEKYIAPKGSVAVKGVSLTINKAEKNIFDVNIIPHTWQETNLSDLQLGSDVNFEIDMLARYVARQMEELS